jgi:hypothetical protein
MVTTFYSILIAINCISLPLNVLAGEPIGAVCAAVGLCCCVFSLYTLKDR